MDIRRLSSLVAILAATSAAGASAETLQATWHAPETNPERALERILKHADSDRDQLDNLLDGRGAKNFRPTVDYLEVLTPPLIATIRREERQRLKDNCGGSYTEQLCGLNFSPISCTQDYNDVYLYRTMSEGESTALVSYRWPWIEMPAGTYRLTRLRTHNGLTRLAGV